MKRKKLADKGYVSHLRSIAGNLFSSLGEPRSEARTVFLRGSTGQNRSYVREALPMALAECGCGAAVLTETEKTLTLCFDLPLEAALCVYWEMVEAGLDFEAQSHHELTRLCTVQSHAAECLVLERPCTARLEVRFRGERRRIPTLQMAAQA